jgi:penicillin-binding protein 1A
MAGAYATLAADGVYHRPSFIDRIVGSDGKTMFTANTAGKRVLDPQISREAVMTLRAVVQYGTGVGAALPDRPVAGKTGTSETNIDAWFNGITPQLVTSVWMGDPKGRTPMQYPTTPINIFGGTYPASIWHAFTEAALSGQPAINFPAPDPRLIPPGKFITSLQLRADSPLDTVPTIAPPTGTPTSTTLPPTSTATTSPGPPITSPITVPTTRPTVPITHPPTTCVYITTPHRTIPICA